MDGKAACVGNDRERVLKGRHANLDAEEKPFVNLAGENDEETTQRYVCFQCVGDREHGDRKYYWKPESVKNWKTGVVEDFCDLFTRMDRIP